MQEFTNFAYRGIRRTFAGLDVHLEHGSLSTRRAIDFENTYETNAGQSNKTDHHEKEQENPVC